MSSETPQPTTEQDALQLKGSSVLQSVPAERAPAPPPAASAPAPAAPPPPAPDGGRGATIAAWSLGATTLLATMGWLFERRQRRLLETEKDSVMWAEAQPKKTSSIITTAGNLDDILPDSPDPAEKARSIYVTAIGETNSRREATLIDLHKLDSKLRRRRERGDTVAAVLLLQQHLVDFRFTSPWVFLELRELYRTLGRQTEWEIARDAFSKRFSQTAPAWTAPSTADAELLGDTQLCEGLARDWPYREARMYVLRWMLGELQARQHGVGPPQLPLGVYRDLMFVDKLLDEVLIARPKAVTESML